MYKLLTCDMYQLMRIFNEGIWVKPDKSSEEFFYDFSRLNFKEFTFGINNFDGVWFSAGSHKLLLTDENKTWRF